MNERRNIMPMNYIYKSMEWTKHIKRKGDKITKEQAIQFLESIPSVGRNVDNHYIEPEDDYMDKTIDYIKRSVDGDPPPEGGEREGRKKDRRKF